MSEIRSMLEDTINKVMKDMCTKELIQEADKGIWPRELWEMLEELGVTAIGVGEEIGGSGGDLGDFMTLLKMIGYYAAPLPLAEHVLSNWMLSKANLPIVSEVSTISFVQNEPNFTVKETAHGWKVSGKLQDVPWAKNATSVTVVAQVNNGNILVNIKTDQGTINGRKNLAGEPRDTISFHEVTVEHIAFLDSAEAFNFYNKATLTRVMLMAGALERTLDLAVTYSKERIQFGRPISKFQAIQQQLAVLAGETTASLAVANYIVNHIDRNIRPEEVAMAKIQLGDAVQVATRIAHQVHGAMGFTDEHPLHQSTRRLWAWRDEFGVESELAKTLGEKVINDENENLWEFITK